ncbi:MAG: cysteine--tRNA ligase, partial [Candidatus Carbobacillus sp.]|nr:cysteine--tRNA ligase [Candidatus Carbobacillus sp.]
LERAYWEALVDDIRTPDALTVLFELVRFGHQHLTNLKDVTRDDAAFLAKTFLNLTDVLGFKWIEEASYPAEIDDLLRAREEARKQRDFQRADALRKEIEARGFRVEDTPSGQRLRALEP